MMQIEHQDLGNFDLRALAKKAPVIIKDNGKPVFVVMDFDNFYKLIKKTSQSKTANKKAKIKLEALVDFWNQQQIVIHQKTTSQMLKNYLKAKKDFSDQEIEKSILNYAKVIHNEASFFRYKWTLTDFLSRGVEKFLSLPAENFLDPKAIEDLKKEKKKEANLEKLDFNPVAQWRET